MSELQFQFISTFIAMFIPLMYVAFIQDKGENRRIILYFCWGLFAGVLSFNLNNALGTDAAQTERMSLSIAPIIEETCKVLPVLLFLRTGRGKNPQIAKVIVYCAMASGIGFSIQESLYYFAVSAREAADILTLVFRTLTTALMHGMTAAAFGIGLMATQRFKTLRVPVIFGLLAFCATIHALFNLLLMTNLAFVAVLMPVAMFFASRVYINELRNENC